MIERYFDLESMSPEQQATVIENPQLPDAAVIPDWAWIRRDWPRSLEPLERVFSAGHGWYEVRAGWPWQTLYGRYGQDLSRELGPIGDLRGVLPIPRVGALTGPGQNHWMTAAIPLIPLWPEFLASTAAYGLAAFVAVESFRSLRAWRRSRQGRCGRCGYDLRGLAGSCPECGAGPAKAPGPAAAGRSRGCSAIGHG